jgi:8-oxo-dGTP pyrophosphatase MutT (NUDIX family)
MTKCLLVQGFKQKSWSFPRGKINSNESELACAVREVDEEVGYDMRSLVKRPKFAAHLEMTGNQAPCPESDPIVVRLDGKRVVHFVAVGVSEQFNFETRTRKEIGDIAWFDVSALPYHDTAGAERNKFWNVAPIAAALRQWISRRGGPAAKRAQSAEQKGARSLSVGVSSKNDPSLNLRTFGSRESGWTPEQMFAAAAQQGVSSHGDHSTSDGRYRQYEPFQFDIDAAMKSLSSGGQISPELGARPSPSPSAKQQPKQPQQSKKQAPHPPTNHRAHSAGNKSKRVGNEKWDQRNDSTFGVEQAGWTPEQMFADNRTMFGVESRADQELRKSRFYAFDGERIAPSPPLPPLPRPPTATTPPLAAQNAASQQLLAMLQRPTAVSSQASGGNRIVAPAPVSASAQPLAILQAALQSFSLDKQPAASKPAAPGAAVPVTTKVVSPAAGNAFSFDSDDIMDSLSFA